MENKNDEWNPMEWQGRSKQQVETSNTLAMISIVGLVVLLIISAIIS